MKLWNLNWAAYTGRGIRQADILWSTQDMPGNPIDHPPRWTLAVENHEFTRPSHWPDYGRNPERRVPDVVDLGEIRARYVCLKIDSNFTESGRGYFGISEIAFSDKRFRNPNRSSNCRTTRPKNFAGRLGAGEPQGVGEVASDESGRLGRLETKAKRRKSPRIRSQTASVAPSAVAKRDVLSCGGVHAAVRNGSWLTAFGGSAFGRAS